MLQMAFEEVEEVGEVGEAVVEVVDLHSGTAWKSVAAAAEALGVGCATVHEWIADAAKPYIVRRPCPPTQLRGEPEGAAGAVHH